MNEKKKKLALVVGGVVLVLLALIAGLESGRGTVAPESGAVPSKLGDSGLPAAGPSASQSVEQARPRPVASDKAVALDSLTVEISPTRPLFTPGDSLVLKVEFRNTGTRVLRLPNNGGLYGDWLIRIEDARGNVQTGAVSQANGRGTLAATGSAPMGPGEVITLNAGFAKNAFQFVTGELDFDAVQKSIGPLPRPPIAARNAVPTVDLEFPEGAYRVTLVARFPNVVTADGDPTRVWPHDAITSNTVEVRFGVPAAAELGWIRGVAVDNAGNPMPGVQVGWTRPSEYNAPPVTDSGYGKAVAARPLPPTAPVLRPNNIYPAGHPSAVTDNNGEFVLKNLPEGVYIVTFATTAPRSAMASVQPVEVKAGTETKLPNPVKVNFVSGVGGGGKS